MKVISCAVDPELAEALAAAAAAKGWPRSRLIRSVLEKWAFQASNRGLKAEEVDDVIPSGKDTRGFLERFFS